MFKNNRSTGITGEKVAETYLKKQRYKIIARNYRTKRGEIDIIASTGKQTLVFAEVKTRTQNIYGTPAEAVTAAKQKQICKTALEYITVHDLHNKNCRFDVISIVIQNDNAVGIEHIKDAFSYIG